MDQVTSLAHQIQMMPSDFRAHFFNSPISARVILDDKYLGDATLVLSEDDRVQLLQFTDISDSEWTEAERQSWLTLLSQPVPLGQCERECPADLAAVDYNLANAQLTLITRRGSTGVSESLWHQLPEKGSSGVLLSNQLNISGGQQQSAAINLLGGLVGAIKNWSAIGQYSLERRVADDEKTQFIMNALYLMCESQNVFYRGGIFTPDSQGVLRQPYTRNSGVPRLGGLMMGTSDTLMKDGNAPALYPIWVTANREGVAEIYRNGVLIHSQPVKPGLQALDTGPLPGGIYDVEVVIKEDGKETSRSNETVNKPSGWNNPNQLVRYNVFIGQQLALMNSHNDEQEKRIALGSSLNYLIHPKLMIGAAIQHIGKETQLGVSFDWQPNPQVKLYSNPWYSNVTGYGLDSQAMWSHEQGSLSFNHSRSWYRPKDREGLNRYDSRPQTEHSSSLSGNYRLNHSNSVNVRLTHRSTETGIGIDAGYSTRVMLGGAPVNLQLAGFDRPYHQNVRNRGVALTANFALGSEGRSASASIGSRMDAQGGRDLYASATLNQDWENRTMKHSSMTVTGDRHGVGLSTYNQFNAPLLSGSFWGQRASMGHQLSGGLSVGSTLALGQGKAALTSNELDHQGGGMIVDVESDDPAVDLVAYHQSGTIPLKAGRNFIPVSAWKPGTLQIDFNGEEAPSLNVFPQYLDYHHVSGGVSSHELRVMKIVTVMGRLVDKQGNPLAGAKVINHAGRTITASDGMFTLDLHETNPVVNIEHASGVQCEIHMRPDIQKRDEIIFAGNVTCEGTQLADKHDDTGIPLAFVGT
nr:CS1-pili formation C-terminal domain-containing protein [Providencia sp. JUb39]